MSLILSETLQRLQFNKDHSREVLTDANEIQNILGDELFVLVESELQGKTYYDLFAEAVDELLEGTEIYDAPTRPSEKRDKKLDASIKISKTYLKYLEKEGEKLERRSQERSQERKDKRISRIGQAQGAAGAAALFGIYKLYKYLKTKYSTAKTPEAKAKIKGQMDKAQAKIKKIQAKKKK